MAWPLSASPALSPNTPTLRQQHAIILQCSDQASQPPGSFLALAGDPGTLLWVPIAPAHSSLSPL